MGKNWLIRTKSNHILGPVSKEKVVELYQNGSIKADDEICSGNGYWFFIRETDLVERYLLGSDTQSFNPISEAKDILTSSNTQQTGSPSQDDITMVGGIDLNHFKDAAAPVAPAAPKPEMASTATEARPKSEPAVPQKKKLKSDSSVKSSDTPAKKPRGQNYLIYLGALIFIILFLLLRYREQIMRSFFTDDSLLSSTSFSLINQAHAQDESPAKKKSFWSHRS